MDDPDMKLVREFVANNSEQAFAALVARNIALVNGIAFRLVNDAHLAQEVTQVTFIILSRKAKTLGKQTIVAAWLCRTARYVASDALRLQRRRRAREREAFMQGMTNDSPPAAWPDLTRHLDAGLGSLRAADHDVLVLRFFKNASFADIARVLGIGESAAKMRVTRGLEKLRKYFGRRGISYSAGAIAGVASAEIFQQGANFTAAAVSAAATAKTGMLGASTLALLDSSLKGMVLAKIKATVAAVAGVALSAAAITTAVTVAATHESDAGSPHALAERYIAALKSRDASAMGEIFSINALSNLPASEREAIHKSWVAAELGGLSQLPKEYEIRVTPWTAITGSSLPATQYIPVRPAFLVELVSRHPEDGKGIGEIAYWDRGRLAFVRPLPKTTGTPGDGVAARVNGRPIMASQVTDLTAWSERAVRAQIPDDRQAAVAVADLRNRGLDELVDRELILQEAERQKIKVPDAAIEERIQAIVENEFAGNRQAFLARLKESGMSPDAFAQIEREKIIVQAMRAHILRSTLEPEQKKRAMENWLASLRKQATIVVEPDGFFGGGAE